MAPDTRIIGVCRPAGPPALSANTTGGLSDTAATSVLKRGAKVTFMG